MRKILILTFMALFTLMLGLGYAQKTQLCEKFRYKDAKDVFGEPFENMEGSNLTLQQTKDGVSYYTLNCEGGVFQWIPPGEQEIPTNVKTSWAFVEKDGKKLAYAKLVRMNVQHVKWRIQGITENTGVQPTVKMEDGKETYTWHTLEGITTKLKIYPVEDPQNLEKQISPWVEVKVAQYFDELRPNKGVVENHLSHDPKK